MYELTDFIAQNPWIWVVGLISLAMWIAAISVVIRSPKFRRKGLWGLLTLVSFSYSWSVSPGETFSLGLPFGAAYVLWFWKFGASPSPDDLETDAARRSAADARPVSPFKLALVRGAYAISAAATAWVGWLIGSGGMIGLVHRIIAPEDADGPPVFQAFAGAAWYPPAALVFALAGLFAFLSVRPYWRGKILCVWAGLSWSLFSLSLSALAGGRDTALTGVLVAGLCLSATAVIHQVSDPRFRGSYLRGARQARSDTGEADSLTRPPAPPGSSSGAG